MSGLSGFLFAVLFGSLETGAKPTNEYIYSTFYLARARQHTRRATAKCAVASRDQSRPEPTEGGPVLITAIKFSNASSAIRQPSIEMPSDHTQYSNPGSS